MAREEPPLGCYLFLSTIQHVEYEFTDISPIFTRRAAQNLVNIHLLTIESSIYNNPLKCKVFNLIIMTLLLLLMLFMPLNILRDTLTASYFTAFQWSFAYARNNQTARLCDFVFWPTGVTLHDEKIVKENYFLSPELWHQQLSLAKDFNIFAGYLMHYQKPKICVNILFSPVFRQKTITLIKSYLVTQDTTKFTHYQWAINTLCGTRSYQGNINI